jgi:transcription elongation factor greA
MAGVGFAIVAKIWIQPTPLWGWLQTKRRFILLPPNMAYNYMTQAGYDKLVAEINELEAVHRPEISRQIAEARDKGDLSENAEYDAAKEAQGLLEGKIAQLKATLANARIIDESRLSTDSVQILTKVTIRNVKTGAELTYTLVSDQEANLKEKKISVNTPIAKGLIGKKVGDVAEVQTPGGLLTFEILDISI